MSDVLLRGGLKTGTRYSETTAWAHSLAHAA
ncbi:hypothetical protein H4W81_000180 [Nonomuraea africana]|uniref:Uncharacterized protein n=1 Tax=Nonomuraea africana TaxID=46171 RepID=A0ABR9K5V3_9ACTN|nr:hypothetical protein [Nonomuraea africana]